MSELREVIRQLRRALTRLEALGARDGRSLDRQVLDCLEDCGALSTDGVARLAQRRRSTVLETLRRLHAAGRITRTADDQKWTVPDVQA